MDNSHTPFLDVAKLVQAIDTDQFPHVLQHICENAAPFDGTVIYAYNGDTPPIDLFHSGDSHELDDYQSRAYLLDPFYHAARSNIAAGLYHLKDLAPDHFFRSDYYHSYYSSTKIIDEIGIFVPLARDNTSPSNKTYIIVSLSREEGSARFRKKEVDRLSQIEPVIREAVIQHWKNPEILELTNIPKNGRYDALPVRVQKSTAKLDKPNLTNREAEVVSLILRGYSSVSISSLLEISVSTVKVHRKNIYAKMHISSQAELFSMFLPLLVNPDTWN